MIERRLRRRDRRVLGCILDLGCVRAAWRRGTREEAILPGYRIGVFEAEPTSATSVEPNAKEDKNSEDQTASNRTADGCPVRGRAGCTTCSSTASGRGVGARDRSISDEIEELTQRPCE